MADRQRIIEFCDLLDGTTENPPRSNITKWNDWYYSSDEISPYNNYYAAVKLYLSQRKRNNCKSFPHCGTGVAYTYYFSEVFLPDEIHYRMYYVPELENYLRKHYNPVSFEEAKPGDLVLYDWNKDGMEDHIGMFVENVSNTKIKAFEHNTSSDDRGSQSNGGMSCYKTRSKSLVAYIYNVIDDKYKK